MANTIKVLVVDDSVFFRQVVGDILRGDPEIEVVGEAADGLEALDKIDELQPDVVCLDLILPKLDGLNTLRRIVEKTPHPAVLIVSAYTSVAAGITLTCLTTGAVDFVLKPSEVDEQQIKTISDELISKVKIAAGVGSKSMVVDLPTAAAPVMEAPSSRRQAVVVGASTGGPAALTLLLPQLSNSINYPVMVAQHLPASFVESLTHRLAKICTLPVRVARDDDLVEPGVIYFASGGAVTRIVADQDNEVRFSVEEDSGFLTPSIDALMQSVGTIYQDGTTAVILSGMGQDGLKGVQAVKDAGGKAIVQDEQSSVVYGMAKEVVDHNLADAVLPLQQIATKVAEVTKT